MADNGIKFTAGIENKVNDQVAKAIQQSRGGINAMFNPQVQRQTKKFVEDLTKSFKSMGMDMAKIDKLITNSFGKQLKEGKKGMDALAESHKKLLRQQERYDKITAGLEQHKERYLGRAIVRGVYSGMSNEDATKAAHAAWQTKLASYSSGSAQLGQAVLDNQQAAMQAQADAQSQKWLTTARRLQLAGIGINAATGAVTGLLGFEGRQLQNEVAGGSFGRSIYHSLASGSFEGLMNLRALSRNSAMMQRLSEKAGTASVVGNVGGAAGGVVQAGAGAAITAANPALGALGGAGAVSGGLSSAGNSVMDLAAGGSTAARAQAALGALEAAKQLDDPGAQHALQWAFQNKGEFSQREMTGRGSMASHLAMAKIGAAIGIGPGAMQGMYDQAAGRVGYGKSAEYIANIAASMQGTYGVDASAASMFLGNVTGVRGGQLTGGKGGSYQQNKEELERIIGRGFALGFRDPNVRNSLIEYAATAAMSGSSGYRTGDMGAILGNVSLGLQAGQTDVFSQNRALLSYQQQNNWLSNTQGYYGQRGFQIAGDVLTGMGHGRGSNAGLMQLVLQSQNLDDLAGNSPALTKLFGGGAAGAALAQQAIQGTIDRRANDLMTDIPGLRDRMAQLREEDERNKVNRTDKDRYRFIARSTNSQDVALRQAMGVWYKETGVSGDYGLGEMAATRDLLRFGGEQVAAPDKAGAAAGKPETGMATDLERATLKAQVVAIEDAVVSFNKQIKAYAAGWQEVQTIMRGNEATDQVFTNAAKAIREMAQAAGELNAAWRPK